MADPPAAPASRVEFTVRGVVQGVGFRYFAWREAIRPGPDGMGRERGDGSVHGIAEGPPDDLEAFLGRLREGPPAALVERVDVIRTPATGSLGPFGVRSGGHRGD